MEPYAEEKEDCLESANRFVGVIEQMIAPPTIETYRLDARIRKQRQILPVQKRHSWRRRFHHLILLRKEKVSVSRPRLQMSTLGQVASLS